MQDARFNLVNEASKETLDVAVRCIADSFARCAPFAESTLLVAFKANPEEVQRIMTKACKQVLSAPIRRDEYEWFKRHVFVSSVWMMKNEHSGSDNFLFLEMMHIAQGMAKKMDDSMLSIFEHLQAHREWPQLAAIQNQSIVERQDDERVGLLSEPGIRDIGDKKDEELQGFVDTNLAVNVLTTTAKQLDAEFQSHVRAVMSRFGDFRAGPLKTVERCQAKLENEYDAAAFPKAAKLLDLVRCSVSFNTVEQLLAGYEGLLRHIDNTDALELARVKNGFLDKTAAFRAIKVSVVFHPKTELDSAPSMICEVQLLLNQYLHEKKRCHKLYSILRERAFFEMVVTQKDGAVEAAQREIKDFKELKFEPVLNVKQDLNIDVALYKCSVDSESGLLGLQCEKKFFCVDMRTKKVVFEQERKGGSHTHHWVPKPSLKYLRHSYHVRCRRCISCSQANNSDMKVKYKTRLVFKIQWAI